MFNRLAKGIINYHKVIVIIWIVLLLPAIFGLQFLGEVIVYEEAGFAPDYVESQEAQNLIDEQFPTSLANSTVIIVVQTSDIAAEDVRDFALMVEKSILENPDIAYEENVTSVYSIYRFVFQETARNLAPIMADMQGQLNATAFLFFSGPSLYAESWRDSVVNDTTFEDSWNIYSSLIEDPWQQSLLENYSFAFRAGWNETFNPLNSTAFLEPGTHYLVRAQHVLDLTTPTFFGFYPPQDESTQIMNATWAGLNITTWDDETILHFLMLNLMRGYSGINSLTFLEGIYQLGEDPSEESISHFADSQIRVGTVNTYPIELPPGSLEFLVNQEANTMLVTVSFSVNADFRDESGQKPMERNVELIRDTVRETKQDLNVQYIKAYVTGSAALGGDIEEAAMKDVERIDPVTIALVFLIIGLFFMSFITPAAAVGGIGIAILVSQALVVIVGSFVAKVHFSVLTLMLTAMLGAGTDYAIFLMARYREERLRGNSKEKSVEKSVKWAGESITTSGVAVMISFGALSLGSFDLVRTMGLTIMMGIGVALLVALTFIPSLLMLLGDRIFWPGNIRWGKGKKESRYSKYFKKSARLSLRYAKPITVLALLISIPATYAVFTLETSFDFLAAMPETEASRGLEVMGEGFGEGRLSPTYIVAEFPEPVRTMEGGNFTYDISLLGSIENLSREIDQIYNVHQVIGPTRPLGESIAYTELNNASYREPFEADIERAIGEDNRTILLTVVLERESFSAESVNTIPILRSTVKERAQEDPNLSEATILVGGASASIRDIKVILDRDFLVMAIVVILADYILLMFVLGSVLVPLRLILTVLLSVSWTIAMTIVVFHLWLQIPILWLMPWVLFVIAMGLGMDYDIFLTTRIREEVAKGKSDKKAIVTAVERTGGIITAAGLVMSGAFATMLLSSLGLLQEFGFALAFAILLDAMIVRIYLVPSVMILLEKWNWWAPGRLQRIRREEKKRCRRNS